MSIDNSQIWDQGIGGPATAMLQQGSAGINPQPNAVAPQQQQQQDFTNEAAAQNVGKMYFNGKWLTQEQYQQELAKQQQQNSAAGYGNQVNFTSGYAGAPQQQNQYVSMAPQADNPNPWMSKEQPQTEMQQQTIGKWI